MNSSGSFFLNDALYHAIVFNDIYFFAFYVAKEDKFAITKAIKVELITSI